MIIVTFEEKPQKLILTQLIQTQLMELSGTKTSQNWLQTNTVTSAIFSLPYDVDAINRIKECVQHRLHNNVAECDEVCTDDIENVISQLQIGKHDGVSKGWS